jgi:signal transduction histidine kinase/ABC-type amino acid transport substrate-binding protein
MWGSRRVLSCALVMVCVAASGRGQNAGPATAGQSPEGSAVTKAVIPAAKIAPAKARTVVVGVRRDWGPLGLADGKGEPTGFAVELFREVAKEAGVNPEFRFCDPSLNAIEVLLSREVDVSATKVLVSWEEEVAQTQPYYVSTAAIFVRRGERRISGIDDLKGKRVAVLRHSAAHNWAVSHSIDVLELDVPRAVLAAVADGRADCCILFRSFALHLMGELGLETLRPLDVELDGVSAGFCFATRLEDSPLARMLDAGLVKVQQSGRARALREKWVDAIEPARSTWTLSREVVVLAGMVLVGVLGILAWREMRLRKRVQVERDVAEASRARFQSAMEGSLDAVFVMESMRDDFGVIRDFRIVDLNERGERLIVATRDEVVGQKLCEFRPINRTGGFFDKYVKVVETGEPLEEEFAIDAPPISATWIYHQVVRAGDGIIITSRNVSERKRLETDARQSQKMEAIGQLAGGIVHDFRNLLLAIQGNLELAKRQVGHAHPAQNSLEQIDEAARQAGNVTQSLLLFTRRAAPTYGRVDLTELVNRTARLLWRTLPPTIRLEVPLDRRPCWVLADETQVQQLLMYLAINGRDAILSKPDATGVLTLTAFTDEEERNVVEVRDTGVGMPQQVIARIFEPYFTTKPRGQGTGLGLSIAHAIVTSIGGSISVDSEVGRGTTIRVQLPPAPDPGPTRMDGNAEPAARQGKRRVALVEPNGLVRSIMTTMLERMNIETVATASAAELSTSLLSQQVDAAIVDLDSEQSPDLAQVRRALGPSRPVLVIRPANFALDVVDPLYAVLNKPFNAAQLSDALQDVFALADEHAETSV